MKKYILIISAILSVACNIKKKDQEKELIQTENSEPDPIVNGFSTYCNPIDIDYSYMTHYAYKNVSYRSGADPAVVRFKDAYYMFVTRSHGYWYSKNLTNWQFISPQSWYFNGSNAPAAWPFNDELLVLGDPSGIGAIIKTDDPKKGNWKTTFNVIPHTLHDPAIFVDDDGKVYIYEGSSNKFPIKGMELDADKNFVPVGEPVDLLLLHPNEHGWERFGQNHKSTVDPFIEGPWMTKHNGKYYLQYAAPGTQWNIYGDGVYVGDHPLGPFTYAPYNPVAYKPGGFLNGAGHGSTVKDHHDNYWHFATMPISVNYKFERRIGMYPAGFEEDGQMYVNTAYGDYPQYAPNAKAKNHKNRFTGWMLLSYKKPVKTNSGVVSILAKIIEENEKEYLQEKLKPEYDAAKVTDENIRTFWVAESNNDSTYLSVDLEAKMKIKAIQINFHDFNAEVFERVDTLKHQFIIEASSDNKTWKTIADYSKNERDQPHAYIEIKDSVEARYIKYKHVHCSNKYPAISELRIFGTGLGEKPAKPANFVVKRKEDRRDVSLSWNKVNNAQGYMLYWGIKPERLNNSVLIYDNNFYDLRALNINQEYFFRVEAFNENGISEKSEIVKTE
ncbi:family 43 glycosylhydrolase [Abyssalbus ytuae]|uniref:Family 43 glycosylhydrolase n=1 Tax=Abyssalbus ytuae TaxID=2926907 RepID=A0A9E6ZUS4_9FLAO|nr:family 43 glycosylhydrolase [Abyssalbus ytuae]UOB17146.1 family 43 glycosylhydrolase [Abyssalbus ytuae]